MNSQIEALRNDVGFQRRLLSGDLHARAEWAAAWGEVAGQPEQLVTPQEMIDQLRHSPDFQQRWVNGDADARKVWTKLHEMGRDGE